ncbi:MAG TPA: cupin domain-containing protein, partial [Chloroflexota bacterium]|nr:cupin domain-containing protein [Chloroflexota bacterium]
MARLVDYRAHAGAAPDRFFKSTLFGSPRLLVGVNCLERGQVQPDHRHADQDKFYFVVEGEGEFRVGGGRLRGRPGWAVWAPAGVEHGLTNDGPDRLVLLVGIAPARPRRCCAPSAATWRAHARSGASRTAWSCSSSATASRPARTSRRPGRRASPPSARESERRPTVKTLATEIEIAAPAERVWEVLA